MSAGEKNAYRCEECQYVYVTVDLVDGVTPFMLRCRNPEKPECGGWMKSAFYRIDPARVPDGEWYRPDKAEASFLSKPLFHHVKQGGLLIRDIKR